MGYDLFENLFIVTNINGSTQGCSISSTNTLEILQSCTMPWTCLISTILSLTCCQDTQNYDTSQPNIYASIEIQQIKSNSRICLTPPWVELFWWTICTCILYHSLRVWFQWSFFKTAFIIKHVFSYKNFCMLTQILVWYVLRVQLTISQRWFS